MRPTSLILGAVAALLVATGPAAAREYSVWGGCAGSAELLKPVKVDRCSRDTSYALYVDQISWSAFGDATATGAGTAHTNVCEPSCGYGVWRGGGAAAVTLSRPRACGDRRLYTHGLIQLDTAYEGRTVFEEDYPCKLVVRRCTGSERDGALRGIAQRATTCVKAHAIVRRWATAAGYQARRYTRPSVRVGAYRCRRFALGRHQLLVTCKATGRRYVRFRAIRS